MSDPNPYLQRPGESIAEWRSRLAAVDASTQTPDEQRQLEIARRGLPLARPKPQP